MNPVSFDRALRPAPAELSLKIAHPEAHGGNLLIEVVVQFPGETLSLILPALQSGARSTFGFPAPGESAPLTLFCSFALAVPAVVLPPAGAR